MSAMRTTPRRRTLGSAAATAAVLALGAGLALPGAAHAATDDATGVILNADAAEAVAGSYIVVLDETVAADSPAAEELAAKYDAEISTVYDTVVNGFAAEVDEADALRLAADPAVDKVYQDEVVELATTTQVNPPSWGLDRIDQPNLPLNNRYTYPAHAGAGVTVFVLDTGIRYTHQDFGGRAVFGFDAFGGTGLDRQGHGTHVASTAAGTAYGVAKAADIVSVKVLNDSGSGTVQSVVAGIDWVTANASGPSVANMSLGGGANSLIDAAVVSSINSGVSYSVAAGNSNANASGFSPARVGPAITVGATTSTDARASYSNWGAIDIFAPGSSITAAWASSDTATNTINGTSMAAPHVAGVAALYLGSNPSASPATVKSALVGAAVTGKVTSPGSGSPNRLLQLP